MPGWLSYLLPKLGIKRLNGFQGKRLRESGNPEPKRSNEMVGGLLAFPKTYHVLFIFCPFDSSNGRNFNLIKGAKAWTT